jgi:Tol biopolymer transport system component/DNA-binding winged helix-turn-helix (wHTH) protein
MAVLDGNSTEVVRFGVFEVNLRAGELRRNGSKLKLQEQPFQILISLLERPGEVVTRDELRSRLWPEDTFVDFDHSLNAAVRRLRDALGDSAETPRFVETVARRGYRFIAPVAGPPTSPAPPPHKRHIPVRWPVLIGIGVLLIASVIVGWRAGHHSATTLSTQERRLTANPSDTPVLSSTLSPDGKFLAFADRTGVYLRQVETGETHPLALPKGFDAQPAAWFPDGSHLLVTWAAGPQEPPGIWEVSVMGGDPRKLVDSGHDPSVSPDGTQIAFHRGSMGAPEIWLMQADGSNVRKLVDADEIPFGPVAWSPNGTRIAYHAYQSAVYFGIMPFDVQIKVLDLTTRKSELIISDPHIGSGLGWARDDRLVYSIYEPPPSQNDSNLWSLPIDDRTGRATGPAVRITSQPGYVGSFSLTADGKKLSMMKVDWQPDVYIANLEARATRLSTPQRLTLDERRDFPFSWTPDAKNVFFTSDRDGIFHIYKQAIDSTVAELVVGGEEQLSEPRLSPDGSMLIYLATPKRASSNVRLMRVPLAGGPPQFILQVPRIMNQQCARLPSTLCIFSELEPNREKFFRFDPITGSSQPLPWATIEDKDPYSFNWTLSPNGQFLAVAKKSGVQKEPSIRIMSVADQRQKTIKVQTWAGISNIDWSADGKSVWAVAYTTRATWALLKVDLTGRVIPMLEQKDPRIGWAIPSPDGRRLALWEASGSANAWLVENF